MLTTNPPESIFAFYFLIRPRKKKQKKTMLPVHTKRYWRFKTNSFATVPQPDYKPPAVECTIRTPQPRPDHSC